MRTIAKSLLLLLAFSAWAADRNADGAKLKRIDATYFTFDIPVDMVEVRVAGIDSHVGTYENSRIRLGFDYGWYSDPLAYDEQLPRYQASKVQVDGRKARIVTFYQADGWFTAIHFPSTGRISDDRVKLTIHASCKTDRELQVAKDIFTSIRFK